MATRTGGQPKLDHPKRRRCPLSLALLAGLVAGLLAGCGRGFDAQTRQPYQPADGANVASGEFLVRNLLVLVDDTGTGTLYGTFVNRGPAADTLRAITVRPSGGPNAGAALSAGGLPLPLPVGSPVKLESGSQVRLGNVEPGFSVTLTLTFARCAPITTWVPALSQQVFDQAR